MRWLVDRQAHSAASGDYPEFVFDMHPSLAVKTLQNATDVRHVGDDLVVQLGETTLRIGPDGQLRDQAIDFTVLDISCSLALVSELSDTSAPAAHHEPPSPPTHVCEEMLAAALDKTMPDPSERIRLRAMVRGVIEAWPTAADHTARPYDPPGFAGEGTPPAMPFLIAGFVQQPCVRRSYTGRLIEACAFASNYLADQRSTARAALEQLVANDQAGPVLLVPLAKLFAMTNNQRYSESLRQLAETRWSFDAIWNDAADVLSNYPSLHDVPARAGNAFRKDPVLQELFSELADGPDHDARAFKIAIRHWWTHGGEAMLRTLLLS